MKTLREVEEIEKEYVNEKLKLACCEYHAHSTTQGCFSGEPKDILIADLCLTIRVLWGRLEEINKLSEEEKSDEKVD